MKAIRKQKNPSQEQLAEILAALTRGGPTYKLAYCAPVKSTFLNVQPVE